MWLADIITRGIRMNDVMLILVFISSCAIVGTLFFIYAMCVVDDVWQEMNKYDRVKGGSYTLMKSDRGDDI